MKKKIALLSLLISIQIVASDTPILPSFPRSRPVAGTCKREQLKALVDEITSQGPQVSTLEGSPENRLFTALKNYHRELILLRMNLQDRVPSSSNQFCPVHGNLEKFSLHTFHSCSAMLPKNKISLKKLTHEKQLADWVTASLTPEIRKKREIIAQTLKTLGFSKEVKDLLEGIFEFTWNCSIKRS